MQAGEQVTGDDAIARPKFDNDPALLEVDHISHFAAQIGRTPGNGTHGANIFQSFLKIADAVVRHGCLLLEIIFEIGIF
jgi:hypothetical protein